MSKAIKIASWNIPAFREIRQSEPVAAMVDEAAQQVVNRLGDGYVYSAAQGKERYRALIYAQGSAGIQREMREQNLLRYATAHIGYKLTKEQ